MVDRQHLAEIAIKNDAARQLETFRGTVVGIFGDVAIGHHTFARKPAAMQPVLVERADRCNVRQIDLLDKLDRTIDDR